MKTMGQLSNFKLSDDDMTQQYDNELTGVLFVADKEGNPNRPDRKGFAEIDGKQYWVSGWDKQTKRGDTISLKFELKKPAVDTLKASEPMQNDPDFDDICPF